MNASRPEEQTYASVPQLDSANAQVVVPYYCRHLSHYSQLDTLPMPARNSRKSTTL